MASNQAQNCITNSNVDLAALARMADMTPDELMQLSDQNLITVFKNGLEQKQLGKYRMMRQQLAVSELTSSFNAAIAGKQGDALIKEAENWFQGLVTTDYSRQGKAGVSAEQLAYGYRLIAYAALTDLTSRLDPKLITPRDLPRVNEEIARYLHGDTTALTDPAMKQMLDGWLQVANGLRERFNSLGGNIGKLEGWGLRHQWDSAKIAAVPKDEWVQEMIPLLDPDKYINTVTGAPIDPAKLRVVLEETYDNIIAGYHGQINPSFVDMPGIIAKRNREERQLHFRNGEAWWEAAQKYAEGDKNTAVLRSMANYVNDLATDTALIEKFGPSAAQTFQYMSDTVKKAVGKDTIQHQHTRYAFENLANQNRSVQGVMKEFGAALRAGEVATKLGAATLSAMSDFAFTKTVANDLGVPFSKVMGTYVQIMAGRSTDEIRKMGFVADMVIRNLERSNRFSDDWGAGKMSWLADKTMKLSGMNRHQHSAMMAFLLEFSGHLGREASKDFAALDPKLHNFFKAYGLKEADWVAMQAATKDGFLIPTDIPDAGQAARILGAMQEETRYAVFEPGARERAVITQGTQRGTFKGELMRFLGLFKSFPIGITTLHYTRMMAKESRLDKGKYAGSILMLSTLLGGVALQAKELSKGRSPREMDGEFFLAAFLQGGSGGILMDIAAKEHYSGAALLEDLAGPALSDLAKFTKATQDVSAALLTADGDALSKSYSDAVNRVSKDVFFTNIWYLRHVLQNQLFEKIRSAVDPQYADRRYGLEGWMKEQNRELYY